MFSRVPWKLEVGCLLVEHLHGIHLPSLARFDQHLYRPKCSTGCKFFRTGDLIPNWQNPSSRHRRTLIHKLKRIRRRDLNNAVRLAG